MPHAHILVVDDESLLRWSLKERLESEGYDVTESKGNQTQAAQLLGINRDQVRYRIEKFGLQRA